MKLPKVVFVLLSAMIATACGVPEPGDPDYDRYLRSKEDRAEHLYEGF